MPKDENLHPSLHKVRYERTFVMVKPDGVMRGLIGDIISRFEKSGLKVVAMKMQIPTEEQVLKHYPSSDKAWVSRLGEKTMMGMSEVEGLDVMELFGTEDKSEIGEGIVKSLIQFLRSGPVVCMIIEGVQAINMVRKIAGHTLPYKADIGTIRGDYSIDTPIIANVQKRAIHNVMHASENAGEAEHEIKLWFGNEPIHDYTLTDEYTMYSKYY